MAAIVFQVWQKNFPYAKVEAKASPARAIPSPVLGATNPGEGSQVASGSQALPAGPSPVKGNPLHPVKPAGTASPQAEVTPDGGIADSGVKDSTSGGGAIGADRSGGAGGSGSADPGNASGGDAGSAGSVLAQAQVTGFAELIESTDMNDPAARARLVEQVKAKEDAIKAEAVNKAKSLGLPVRVSGPDGQIMEIRGFDGDRPIYNVTDNANAAIASGARPQLSLAPYGLSGSEVNVGVWDGGVALSTHVELLNKVVVKDEKGKIDDHPTHVAGTITARGTNPLAKGMAPAALSKVHSYDWDNDISEMLAVGAIHAQGNSDNQIPISNHSYGNPAGYRYSSAEGHWKWSGSGVTANSTDSNFGVYDYSAREWDALALKVPYLSIFKSAGNERDNVPSQGAPVYNAGTTKLFDFDSATSPKGDGQYRNGFDTMTTYTLAKNVITIGAVDDAVMAGNRTLGNATMSTFSSWGPTDDGRIKPDLVANGVQVVSALSNSTTGYVSWNGTSMATPSAAGSAALLVELWKRYYQGEFMPSSMMKALLIHTADDLGRPGPDYEFGWGHINVKAAADVIKADYLSRGSPKMITGTFSQNKTTYTQYFESDGVSPISATLCWTDPSGPAQSTSDNRTSVLVHNLDLLITGPNGEEWRPYVMPYVGNWTVSKLTDNAIFGKNNTDNVEQVSRKFQPQLNGPGYYTVTVALDGQLQTRNPRQDWSLIVTGGTALPKNEAIIKLSPGLSYGALGEGGSQTLDLKIANIGDIDLVVAGIDLPGPQFSGNYSGTIGRGEEVTVPITFTASSADTEYWFDTLRVRSNAASGRDTAWMAGSVKHTLAMTNGEMILGFSGGNAPWRYFQITVPPGQESLKFVFNYYGSANVYIRHGNIPDTEHYNYFAGIQGSGNPEDIEISNPAAGNWYVYVQETNGFASGTIVPSYKAPIAPTRILRPSGNLHFGNVPQFGEAIRTITLHNDGNSPLTVSGLSVPTGYFKSVFTNSGLPETTIPPGGTDQMDILFIPQTVGYFLGYLEFESDKTAGAAGVGVSGSSVTEISALQNAIPEGPISALNDALGIYYIDVPAGQSLLTINATIGAGGQGNAKFYVNRGSAPSTEIFGYKQNAGTPIVINSPQAGRWFILTAADPQYSGLTLSASYQGLTNDSRLLRLVGDFAFGPVAVNESRTQEMKIWNAGNAPLAVSSITFPPGFSGEWSGVIQPGDKQPVPVTFAPPGEGSYVGNIQINSNATEGNSTATVTGLGTPNTLVTELQNGLPATGLSGVQGSNIHYLVEVPEGVTSMTVSITGGTGDADLYVRRSQKPTITDYDFRPYLDGNEETVEVANPAAGTWYIMLDGVSNTPYSGVTLSVVYTQAFVSGLLSNPAGITIPSVGAASIYPSPINVSGLAGKVTKVIVGINGFSHNYTRDVNMLLVAPDGTAVVLMDDQGFGNPTNNVNLIFDDDATHGLPADLVSGTFRPSPSFNPGQDFLAPAPAGPYAVKLSDLIGTAPNGEWKLYVSDQESGASGSITGGWTLKIYTDKDALQYVDLKEAGGGHTLEPASAKVGQSMHFRVNIRNGGAFASGPFTVRLRLSTDTTFTNSDIFLKDVAMASIGGESTATLDTTFVIPGGVTPGNYYLGWELDYGNLVAEENESNNNLSTGATIPISSAASSAAIALTGNLSFGDVFVNTARSIDFTISNPGNATLTVSAITYPPDFSGTWSGGTIAPGASRIVNVTFLPSALAVRSGVVTVNSDAASGTNSLPISGAGTNNLPVGAILGLDNLNLTLAASLSGAAESERRFELQIPDGRETVRIATGGGTGDVDMFVAIGRPPTQTDFDFRPFVTGNEEQVEFAASLLSSSASTSQVGQRVTTATTKTVYVLLVGVTSYSGVDLAVETTEATSGPQIAGIFSGLVGEGQLGTGTAGDMAAFSVNNGSMQVATKADGTFSGKLFLEGKGLSVKGKFDASGSATVTIKRPKASNAVAVLQMDNVAPGKITGTVSTSGPALEFELLPSLFTGAKGNLHPLGGKTYTVALPAPDTGHGHGYAVLKADAKGIVKALGVLADGTKFKAATRITQDSNQNWLLPLHAPVYGKSGGMIFGEAIILQTEPADAADVTGNLGWLRPANAKALVFPLGFLKELGLIGERYTFTKSISVLSGSSATTGFTQKVSPAGGSTIFQGGTWPASNVPVLSLPVTDALKLSFSAKDGIIKGSVGQMVNGKSVAIPYSGVIFSNPLTLPGGNTPVRGAGLMSKDAILGQIEITQP